MTAETPSQTPEESANRRAEYWKAEHAAANMTIAGLERDLTAAREQIAALTADRDSWAEQDSQHVGELVAAMKRVKEIDAENGALKAKLIESRARVAELEAMLKRLTGFDADGRAQYVHAVALWEEARALLSPSPEQIPMTDHERDQKWVRDACDGALIIDNGRYVLAPEQLRRFAAFTAGSRSGEDARDAARYRWLRDQSAYVGVTARKECLWTLRGVYELPGKGFDAAIDAAMGGNDA